MSLVVLLVRQGSLPYVLSFYIKHIHWTICLLFYVILVLAFLIGPRSYCWELESMAQRAYLCLLRGFCFGVFLVYYLVFGFTWLSSKQAFKANTATSALHTAFQVHHPNPSTSDWREPFCFHHLQFMFYTSDWKLSCYYDILMILLINSPVVFLILHD